MGKVIGMSTKERVEKTLRNTWLAGLGVYRTGLDTLGEQIDKRYEEGVSLFDQCVERGTTINDELMKPVTRFESQVTELREKLGLDKPSVDDQLTKLEHQLSLLAEKVEALQQKPKTAKVAVEAKPETPEPTPKTPVVTAETQAVAAKPEATAKPDTTAKPAAKRTPARARKAAQKKASE